MNAVKVGLAIGIGLLFPLLTNMTVQIFRQPPEYMDYYEYYPPEPKTAAERKTAEADARAKRERYEKASNEFNEFAFYVTFAADTETCPSSSVTPSVSCAIVARVTLPSTSAT